MNGVTRHYIPPMVLELWRGMIKKSGLPLGIPQMSGCSGSQKDRKQEDCVFYSYMQTKMKLVQSMYQ